MTNKLGSTEVDVVYHIVDIQGDEFNPNNFFRNAESINSFPVKMRKVYFTGDVWYGHQMHIVLEFLHGE